MLLIRKHFILKHGMMKGGNKENKPFQKHLKVEENIISFALKN